MKAASGDLLRQLAELVQEVHAARRLAGVGADVGADAAASAASAAAECTFTGPTPLGATLVLRGQLRPDVQLFGESTGRVLVTTADPEALLALAGRHGVPAQLLGKTGGERLRIGPESGEAWLDRPVAELRERWQRAIPRRVEAP